jgi:hypothetical protein
MWRKAILFMLLFSLSAVGRADVPTRLKKLFFTEIAHYVAYEEDGILRGPAKLEDFVYLQTDEFTFSIKGESFSIWDQKKISYDCTVNVLTRMMIRSAVDFDLYCTLENENWPFLD